MAKTKPAVIQQITEMLRADPTKIEVFFNQVKKIPLS
jgi:phenylpyruvate tautomerase PptA (4-oxalocrotonate tautomerase family)